MDKTIRSGHYPNETRAWTRWRATDICVFANGECTETCSGWMGFMQIPCEQIFVSVCQYYYHQFNRFVTFKLMTFFVFILLLSFIKIHSSVVQFDIRRFCIAVVLIHMY